MLRFLFGVWVVSLVRVVGMVVIGVSSCVGIWVWLVCSSVCMVCW